MKKITAFILSIILIFTVLPFSFTAVDGTDNIIHLYDGENKLEIGTLTYAQYKKYDSLGDLIYDIDFSYTEADVTYTVKGPHKYLASDEQGNYRKTFVGWYKELPIKLYVSSWNWNIENSMAGVEPFDKNGKPIEALKYTNRKGKSEYRLFAYFVSEDYFDTVVSYADATKGDGTIDSVYFNFALPSEMMFDSVGFILDDSAKASDKTMRFEGKPLLVVEASSYATVSQSECYNFNITAKTVTGLDENGFRDGGRVVSLYLKNIEAYKNLSVRSFFVAEDGSVVYGEITKITFKDGGSSLPLKK